MKCTGSNVLEIVTTNPEWKKMHSVIITWEMPPAVPVWEKLAFQIFFLGSYHWSRIQSTDHQLIQSSRYYIAQKEGGWMTNYTKELF